MARWLGPVPRRAAGALCAFLILLSGTVGAGAAGPIISAPDAIVIDGWTGQVLYAKHPDAVHDPASTVKIMTALLTLERRVPLSRVATVSPYAASFQGSSAGLYAGERLTVRDLLYGMLLPSGNDAAIALSELVAGGEQQFVSEMNREAFHLHLWHTHFLTPNGFDSPGQVTTARDLAMLTRAAMQWPAFERIVRTRDWSAWDVDRRVLHRWQNLNKLLWTSRAVDGVKTGTTPGAGACLVSSARRKLEWVIAVNLGSSAAARFSDGVTLLNYGLARASRLPSTR